MAGKRSKGNAKGRSKSRNTKSNKKIAKVRPGAKAKRPPAAKAKPRRVAASSKRKRPGAKRGARRAAAKPRVRGVASTGQRRVGAPMAAGSKGAPAPKAAPARGSSKLARPAKAKRAAGGLVQGAFDFEIEPPESSVAIEAHLPPPMPSTRRRGAPKANSPDYPGESLTVGMPAPNFSLPSTLGRPVRLDEFRGKLVILYFYPKDDTPGCTMEACAFRDAQPRVEAKDAVVLGISLDDELSHQRFLQKYNLNF